MLGSLSYSSLTLVLRVFLLGGSNVQFALIIIMINFEYAVGILFTYFIVSLLLVAVDWSLDTLPVE